MMCVSGADGLIGTWRLTKAAALLTSPGLLHYYDKLTAAHSAASCSVDALASRPAGAALAPEEMG
jgi:hypothetical protein